MNKENIKKMWIADQGDGTYTNPILYTDYSDPDAIRVGEDYFMIASSFCNSPGVPLLHSKDLVNWKVINYICDKLPFPRYDKPEHGCGTWAPSIRYHEGTYYVFIPFPDEGIMVSKTTDPWGEWSELFYANKVIGWIDPCPLWDDDGKAYMVNAFAKSRIGFKSYLYVSPMEPDCTGLLEDGKFVFDGHETQPTIEGPKFYKRNGYYYIFAPAGGVKPGWQTVLRSKNVYGPYEEKIVMHQGNSPVNGPHQGAWVDTPDGQDWFLHFQDVGNAGRIVHLQPMRWVDDWPIIGVNEDENGCGEPVMHYQKPDVGATYPIDAPEDSDFFEDTKLGLQWQWNANYRDNWYGLDGKQLTLNAQPAEEKTQLCDISNLLIQKWPAPEFQITTCMHLEDMKNGDVAGLVSLGGCYTALAVQKKDGKFNLQQRTGNWTMDDEIRPVIGTIETDTLYIRMFVEKENYVSFAISGDGENFAKVGTVTEALPGRWVGVKSGLFAINELGREGGSAKFDYFVFQPLGE